MRTREGIARESQCPSMRNYDGCAEDEEEMAFRWGGFSEDDIKKVKSLPAEANSTVLSEREDLNAVKLQPKVEPFLNEMAQSGQRSRDEPFPCSQKHIGDLVASGKDASTNHVCCTGALLSENSSSDLLTDHDENTVCELSSQSNNSTRSVAASLILPVLSNPLSSSLKNFGAKQKLMEEKNRLRKVYLSKALEDRKKRTQEEQLRLNMIQAELLKLDQRLSNDVSIIRDQIETASVEFMEAQKRYDRAEKEYLDAKFLLYTKLERKELLTHHLCTIIEQNEMRKAQKLSELMEKLNLPDNSLEDPSAFNSPSKFEMPPANKGSPEIILTPASVTAIPEASPSVQK